MNKALVTNIFAASVAYQQADLCAKAAHFGLATGAFMLFFCMLSNRIFLAWLTGR